ncbi:hypothetical protein HYW94_03625 [Candidatus Uhrbacteria bacterium]|nr:hypothetical protein [Candidatus Uhrbacteria bacterium]
MARGEFHSFHGEEPIQKDSLFERIKKLGMPLAFLVTTGCHPSPVSPKVETPTSLEQQEKMIEISVRQNIYEESALELFSSAPETEEARTYQSAVFKYLTTHTDYQNMKDGKVIFSKDIVDPDKENVSHLNPQSLSLYVAFISHAFEPTVSLPPWDLSGMLPKIQKEFGIPDSKGVLNEQTFHAIDAAWKPLEDRYREANQRWKELCNQVNIESRVKGTTGISLLDALAVLVNRTYQEEVIQKVPDHLKKYSAGEGNTFLYQKNESPFWSTLFSTKESKHNLFIHELGHNIFGFGLQGGKSKKLHDVFHGGAYGDAQEKGADLMPFFTTVFGGRKIPASYVNHDLSSGVILRYSDSPMNEFDEISWKFGTTPKREGVEGKYFINDGIEKTAQDGFVSGYAATNFLEDEAETFKIVLLFSEQEKRGLELAGADSDIAKKFAFMHKVLDKDTFTAWQEKYNF